MATVVKKKKKKKKARSGEEKKVDRIDNKKEKLGILMFSEQ